jgi:hypothetical protein
MHWEGSFKMYSASSFVKGWLRHPPPHSASPKTQTLNFLLSLHHSNNRLENICIFYLPLFNSVVQNCSLVEKLLEGHLTPTCSPPNYAYGKAEWGFLAVYCTYRSANQTPITLYSNLKVTNTGRNMSYYEILYCYNYTFTYNIILRTKETLLCRQWTIILCFVDRPSLYNLANKSNYVHNSA